MSISGVLDDFVRGVTKGAGMKNLSKELGDIKKIKSNGSKVNLKYNDLAKGLERATNEVTGNNYKPFVPKRSSQEMINKVDKALKIDLAPQMKKNGGKLGNSIEIGDATREVMSTQEGKIAFLERAGLLKRGDVDVDFGAADGSGSIARKAGNFFGNPTYNAYQAHKSGKSLGESFDAGFRNAEGNVDVGKVAGTLSAGGVALGAARGVTTNANGERDIAGIPGI